MENTEIFPFENIQLNPQELEVISNPSLTLESEIVEAPNVIYGRMLSGKSVNKAGLKNLFESFWQNKAGVKIDDYAEGIISLNVESEAIKNRILRGQPWHFAGSYLILIEADAMAQITPDLFKKIPFWIQVNGIPPGHLMKPYGERLGKEIANSMGDFMEFDPNYRRSFMRIRVCMDSTRPLPRGKFLKLDKQKDNIWISFRYERLFKLCYFCGHLDHVQRDCAALMDEVESGHNPSAQYDKSIKAGSLGYVAYPDANMNQRADKKSITQLVVEVSRSRPKIPSMELNTKRQKVGITNEDTGVDGNTNRQNDEPGGANKILPNIGKSATKGSKVNPPAGKQAKGGQNDPSA